MLVGLTGGIGSGKSTVARLFVALGVPVFQSDEEARQITDTDGTVRKAITDAFGEVYNGSVLNRQLMAEKVFNNPNALKQLNAIVHPAVGKKFAQWVEQHHSFPVLLKEAAILIESGAHVGVDQIILVKADEQTRIQRVMKRNGWTEDEVRSRMSRQLSDSEKEAYADFVITNNEEPLIPQVIAILEQLKSPA